MPLARDFTVGFLTADFAQLFSLRAVLPMAELARLRLVIAAPRIPPASAPTVVAPRIFAVPLTPFRRFDSPADDLEVLDFIDLKTTSLARTPSHNTTDES